MDTLYVAPITALVSNPAVVTLLVGLVASGLSYLFGLVRIPASTAKKLIEWIALIVIAIAETRERTELRPGKTVYADAQKLDIAVKLAETAIKQSPHAGFFAKMTRTLGGITNVVSVVYPLVKPAIRRIK